MSYSYDCAYEDIGFDVSVSHRRFVSMSQIHLAAFETVIKANSDTALGFNACIDATQTLNGTQHIF